jgi:hypothetical protein
MYSGKISLREEVELISSSFKKCINGNHKINIQFICNYEPFEHDKIENMSMCIDTIEDFIIIGSNTIKQVIPATILKGDIVLSCLKKILARWSCFDEIKIYSPFIDDTIIDIFEEIKNNFYDYLNYPPTLILYTRITQSFGKKHIQCFIERWKEKVNGFNLIVKYSTTNFHAKFFSCNEELVLTSFNISKYELNQYETLCLLPGELNELDIDWNEEKINFNPDIEDLEEEMTKRRDDFGILF